MATTAAERKKLDKLAQGENWGVLPPEPGHPYPEVGWRLYNRLEPFGWTHLFFGARAVIEKMRDAAIAQEKLIQNTEKSLAQGRVTLITHNKEAA